MSEKEFYNQLLGLENSLEKFAYRLTRGKTDVKDLVQETFLKGILHRDKFVNDKNLKAWTYTIMKNTFINNYRRTVKYNSYYSQTDEPFNANKMEVFGTEDPDSAYSAIEIKENIEQLKDSLRIPLKMHMNGYKYKEIADKLNLNIGTVKSRIFMSRRRLRELLNM
jgi:RNA polymerase sigma factor (sigma-70 family)